MARGSHQTVDGVVLKRGRRRARLVHGWASPTPDSDVVYQAEQIARSLAAGGSAEVDRAHQLRALKLLGQHLPYLEPLSSPPALQTVFDGLLARLTIDDRVSIVPRAARWHLRLESPETDQVVAIAEGALLHLRAPYSTVTLCGVAIEPSWRRRHPSGLFGYLRRQALALGEMPTQSICWECCRKGEAAGLAQANDSFADHPYGDAEHERLQAACRDEILTRLQAGPSEAEELVDELEYQVERRLTVESAGKLADEVLGKGVDWIRNNWLNADPWGPAAREGQRRLTALRYDHYAFYANRRKELDLMAKISRPRKADLVRLIAESLEAEIPFATHTLAGEARLLNHRLIPQLLLRCWPDAARVLLHPEIDTTGMLSESRILIGKLHNLDSASEHPLAPAP